MKFSQDALEILKFIARKEAEDANSAQDQLFFDSPDFQLGIAELRDREIVDYKTRSDLNYFKRVLIIERQYGIIIFKKGEDHA